MILLWAIEKMVHLEGFWFDENTKYMLLTAEEEKTVIHYWFNISFLSVSYFYQPTPFVMGYLHLSMFFIQYNFIQYNALH